MQVNANQLLLLLKNSVYFINFVGVARSAMMVPFQWIFCSLFLLTFLWVALKIFRRRKNLVYSFKQDMGLGHSWLRSNFAPKPAYCSNCLQFCVSGNLCEICGICVCPEDECLKLATAKNSCKPLTASTKEMTHSWVRGNLPLLSECCKCFSPCGTKPELVDFRCLWCQKTIHEYCAQDDPNFNKDDCTLGPFRQIIIPPTSVTVREEGWRGKKRVVVTAIKPPDITNWRPLVVLANPRSGGKDGQEVMSMLRRLLNPLQVSY